MVRSWHFRAATAVAKATSATDLNMISREESVRRVVLDGENDACE